MKIIKFYWFTVISVFIFNPLIKSVIQFFVIKKRKKILQRGNLNTVCTLYLKSQNSTKNIPVIIVSATAGIAKMAEEAGADDFIEKPFQIKYLLGIVSKWI